MSLIAMVIIVLLSSKVISEPKGEVKCRSLEDKLLICFDGRVTSVFTNENIVSEIIDNCVEVFSKLLNNNSENVLDVILLNGGLVKVKINDNICRSLVWRYDDHRLSFILLGLAIGASVSCLAMLWAFLGKKSPIYHRRVITNGIELTEIVNV